jgi:hypothetical protein
MTRFDEIARSFSERRLSRRETLARGGAGLAAAGLGVAGLTSARAQEATPAPADASGEKTEFLFVQSFQSGNIVPKGGEAGTWTLTLEHGLGQTIYFSDRPERIVGTSPTEEFLKGLGFPKENPPNAALLFENDKGEEDISVVELFNPTYDTTTNTATYEIQLLKEYAGSGMTFQQQPTEPSDAGATFGAAHLFIDDCSDAQVACCSQWDYYNLECDNTYVGYFPSMGYCYSWWAGHCQPCEPYGHSIPACKDDNDCPELQYWAGKCNDNFDACNGICWPIFYP